MVPYLRASKKTWNGNLYENKDELIAYFICRVYKQTFVELCKFVYSELIHYDVIKNRCNVQIKWENQGDGRLQD